MEMKFTKYLSAIIFILGCEIGAATQIKKESGPLVKATPEQTEKLIDSTLIIKKGTLIEIDSYDSMKDLFTVVIVKEPGVGPNFVKSQELYTKIKSQVSFERFKSNAKDLYGGEFELVQDLQLVEE